MIWRLSHPIRGILAFLCVLVLGSFVVSGFGVGLPELVVLTLISAVAFVIASREARPA